MAIRYCAPKGTEVCTNVGGEEVRLRFDKDGYYSTSDPALIAILDDAATSENHFIGFAPKEKGK